jgi:hypothetical protein
MAKKNLFLGGALAASLLAGSAFAGGVEFKDPSGDDFGPGTYKYPTDPVYKKGSFDLTALKVKHEGDKVTFDVGINSNVEDPWKMGAGFSVQMVFIFIDTKEGGRTEGLPGLNVKFDEKSGWEKAVIISPQGVSRVKGEVSSKAAQAQGDIVVPTRVKGTGRYLSATVPLADLGGGDPSQWGFQVVVQSNEGFPASTDLLTRKVNEYEGQHRFGGGTDTDCDPNAIDVLAGDGKGDASEVDAQKKQLTYECNADGTSKQGATLTMVRGKK